MGYEVHIDWAGGTAFSGTADNMSASVRSITVDRGRDQAFSAAVPAGGATFELLDPNGLWNPANAASTYDVRPGLPVRIRYVQTTGGTVHGLFRGTIRRVLHKPRGGDEPGVTIFEAEDAFGALANLDARREMVTVNSPWTAGSAIEDVLTTYAAYPYQSIQVSGGELDFSGYVSGDDQVTDALTIIGEIVQAEGGDFFIRGSGTATYRTLFGRLVATPAGTVTNVASGIEPVMDVDRVVNRVTIGQNDNRTRTSDNTASQSVYGVKRGNGFTNRLIMGTAGAISVGEWIVATGGSADVPVERLTFMSGVGAPAESDTRYIDMLRRDVGDRIQLVDTPSKLGTVDVFIERVHHSIADNMHMTEWGVTPYPSLGTAGTAWTPFTLGTSTFGGSHILVL